MKTTRHFLIIVSLFVGLLTLLVSTPLARAQAAGTLDALEVAFGGSFPDVVALAVQPDGKTIIAGSFTSINGVPRSNIARLNADGSLDTGFDPKPNSNVSAVVVQSDGKILLGGVFTTLQPNGAATATTRLRIARLNADGSLDAGFDPKPSGAANTVTSIAVQSDGKVLIGGAFTTLQPNGAPTVTARQNLARVNADGSLDTGFDPKPNGIVRCMAVQEDGKILLGGGFGAFQPNGAASATNAIYVARLNADGSLDSGFNPNPTNHPGEVLSFAVQADGKILLGGIFTSLQPNGAASATPRLRIARVNANGSLDTGFDPKASYQIYAVTLQADGKILLGGDFTTLQPNGAAISTARQYIARVNADGSLDTDFDPKANGRVHGIALQADGKILLGGLFTSLQPNGAVTATARSLFARLNNDSATQILSVPDATQVRWLRGGALPEISQVTFEQSINGGATWTLLGNGTRVGTTANWQITGLTLPPSGQLRARGRPTSVGAYYVGGGSGLVESVLSYGLAPDIAVEQPLFSGLVDGTSSIAFGALNVGSSSPAKTFTIKNTGNAALTGLAITKDGTNSGDFTVSAPGSTTVTPGNSTTFTVTFAPGATSPRSAAIHITSNVTGAKNPFDINLTGTLLSFATDADGDGLSDASEFQMATLGFDWQVDQPALVNTLTSSLNGAGYFTPSQVQALNVGVPLIQRNPATGVFTLTIGVRKTTSLSLPFADFPMNAPGTTTVINGQGKLEFGFTVPDNAAFFRLEAQ